MYNLEVMAFSTVLFWVGGVFFIRWSIKGWWMRKPVKAAFALCGVLMLFAAIIATLTAIGMAVGY